MHDSIFGVVRQACVTRSTKVRGRLALSESPLFPLPPKNDDDDTLPVQGDDDTLSQTVRDEYSIGPVSLCLTDEFTESSDIDDDEGSTSAPGT